MSWDRLENYRVKTGKTWPQVAEDIGLGKSMLMMVKTGKRSLSSKAIYLLEQAEIASGIKASEPSVEYVEKRCYIQESEKASGKQKSTTQRLENIERMLALLIEDVKAIKMEKHK